MNHQIYGIMKKKYNIPCTKIIIPKNAIIEIDNINPFKTYYDVQYWTQPGYVMHVLYCRIPKKIVSITDEFFY